jgi:hypothetical protein
LFLPCPLLMQRAKTVCLFFFSKSLSLILTYNKSLENCAVGSNGPCKFLREFKTLAFVLEFNPYEIV